MRKAFVRSMFALLAGLLLCWVVVRIPRYRAIQEARHTKDWTIETRIPNAIRPIHDVWSNWMHDDRPFEFVFGAGQVSTTFEAPDLELICRMGRIDQLTIALIDRDVDFSAFEAKTARFPQVDELSLEGFHRLEGAKVFGWALRFRGLGKLSFFDGDLRGKPIHPLPANTVRFIEFVDCRIDPELLEELIKIPSLNEVDFVHCTCFDCDRKAWTRPIGKSTSWTPSVPIVIDQQPQQSGG